MMRTLLMDALSHVNFELFNVSQIYFLFLFGVLIAVYLLRLFSHGLRMKNEAAAVQHIKLNCWFCNVNVDLPSAEKESWICPNCQQYNGFTEDGDYSQPIKEQFDVKDHKTQTVCSPSEFITSKSVLCETCSQNQVLKVSQLAAFTPFCDASYDDEIDAYRDYLETRYHLCDSCNCKVAEYLTTQDQKLTSTMKEEHLSLLHQLKNKCQQSVSHHMKLRARRPLMPRLMLILSTSSGFVYVILGWMLHPIFVSQNMSYFSQVFTTRLSVLPDWLVPLTEQTSLCLGTFFCITGLLLAGKCSLYPEDAVHLLLWLLLIVMSCDLPALSWLNLRKDRCVWVRTLTLALSFICCFRNRLPRHLTAFTMHKKQIMQLDLPVRESVSTMCKHANKADTIDASLSSSCLQSLSPISSESSLQFENVQQNLECLSLGLTKKSGSNSSIWSIPAIVSGASSSTSPDSTTESSSQFYQQSNGVLSPSRLSFLNLDSALKDGQCHPSNCFSSTRVASNLYSHSSKTHVQHSALISNSHSPVQPELQRLSSDNVDSHSVNDYGLCLSAHRSVTPSTSALSDVGPCDSQTTDNSNIQLFYSNRPRKHQSKHIQGSETSSWRSPTRQNKTSSFRNHSKKLEAQPAAGHPMDSGFQNTGHRRSQRIAMIGKSPKPWSLKKSLSCNSIGNWQSLQASKSWGDAGFAASNHTQDGHVGSDKLSSVMRSNISSVPGIINSQVFQKITKSDRSNRINSLPGGHSCKHRDMHRQSLSEFSDDEYDVCENIRNNDKITQRQERNDLSWTWMFVGIVMGASITTNIFLLCQGWWDHAS